MEVLATAVKPLGLAAIFLSFSAYSYEAARVFPRQELSQAFCSDVNTGSGSANISQWQSNGLCSDYCTEGDYAFAVVQWTSCWCSNVEPGDGISTDVSRCSEGCPGYPDKENCGRRPGFYGYIKLNADPTSTQGADDDESPSTSSSSSSTKAPPSPPVTETVENTVIVTRRPSFSSSSSTESTESSSQSTSDESEESTTGTPTPSETTVTADGTVRTIFVTPTPDTSEDSSDSSASADAANAGSEDSSSGPSTGTVVGIVVGVIAGVLALAGLILFLFFRRRKQKRDAEPQYSEPAGSNRGSSAGMIGGASRNPEMTVTVDGAGNTWEPDATSEQRRSRLMAVDPRMDPFSRRNKSHESINTLRDDQDYSRRVAKPVLRPTNPDPVNED